MTSQRTTCSVFYGSLGISGFTSEDSLLMTIKELCDNAIDACRSSLNDDTKLLLNQSSTRRITPSKSSNVSIQVEPVVNTNKTELQPSFDDMIDSTLSEFNTLRIKVSDSGCGISATTIEHLATLFASSKRELLHNDFGEVCNEYPQSGRFGLGLKMVLLNSANSGASGMIHFKLRVSQDHLWKFVLAFNPLKKEIMLTNHENISSSLTEWPWTTSVSVDICYHDTYDERIDAYILLASLLNPQIRFHLTYPKCNHQRLSSEKPLSHSYNCGDVSAIPLKKLEIDGAIQLLPPNCQNQDWLTISRIQHMCHLSNISILGSIAHRLVEDKTDILVMLLLCQSPTTTGDSFNHSNDEQETDKSRLMNQHLTEESENGVSTLWCWRSVNRVALIPSDASSCLITKSIKGFVRTKGQDFGLFGLSLREDDLGLPSWLEINQGNAPDQRHDHSNLFKLSIQGTITRSPFANWTDLLMFINIDTPSLVFGTLSKSFVRGPPSLSTLIKRALHQTFDKLRSKGLSDVTQLEGLKDAQYRKAIQLYAPAIAKSLTEITIMSSNLEFKHRMANLLQPIKEKKPNMNRDILIANRGGEKLGNIGTLEEILINDHKVIGDIAQKNGKHKNDMSYYEEETESDGISNLDLVKNKESLYETIYDTLVERLKEDLGETKARNKTKIDKVACERVRRHRLTMTANVSQNNVVNGTNDDIRQQRNDKAAGKDTESPFHQGGNNSSEMKNSEIQKIETGSKTPIAAIRRCLYLEYPAELQSSPSLSGKHQRKRCKSSWNSGKGSENSDID